MRLLVSVLKTQAPTGHFNCSLGCLGNRLTCKGTGNKTDRKAKPFSPFQRGETSAILHLSLLSVSCLDTWGYFVKLNGRKKIAVVRSEMLDHCVFKIR